MDENLSQIKEKPTLEDIQNKIKLLSTYQDNDLKGAMDDLKKALHQNPEACSLILPEEIGEMVKVLMKIEGKIINQEREKNEKKKKEKEKPLTKEEIENLVDEM